MASKKIKAVVALSGGVDSSAAALLALQKGYEVIAATVDLTPPEAEWQAAWSCGGDDREVIRAITEKLGIPHHYIKAYPEFEQDVLRFCAEEYAVGRTPNPCTLCNPAVKFGLLARFARDLGAEKLITGHYAKFSDDGLIVRGSDPAKDQSYFLYRLPRNLLEMIEFPVGDLDKEHVRKLAAEAGLPSAKRPDSQDACFKFPGEGFAETLFRRFQLRPRKGVFVYQDKVVGRHSGIHRLTIGQRKGLNVALGVPGYVQHIGLDGKVNLVTDQRELEASVFTVKSVNIQTADGTLPDEELQIQIRYRTPAGPGRVRLLDDGRYEVVMQTPHRAITPGQAAVFFRRQTLLGGGIIDEVML